MSKHMEQLTEVQRLAQKQRDIYSRNTSKGKVLKTGINFDAPPPPGHVFIDIVEGVEGPSVYICSNNTGYRVAGPKPWGGGATSRRFTASLDDLKRAIESHA